MCLFLSLSTSPTLSLLSISIVDLIKIECRSVKVLTFYKLEMHYIVPKFKFIFRMYFFCPRLKITVFPTFATILPFAWHFRYMIHLFFCYHSSICMLHPCCSQLVKASIKKPQLSKLPKVSQLLLLLKPSPISTRHLSPIILHPCTKLIWMCH